MRPRLIRVYAGDEALVQQVLTAAPTYHRLVQGTDEVPEDAARSLFAALPPDCSYDQKHNLLIEQAGRPVGIVDLIMGFPEPHTAYLGLLLLQEDAQAQGLGRSAYEAVEKYLREADPVIHTVRLSYVNTNPVEKFWAKMGFKETGITRPYAEGRVSGLVVILEKSLQ